MTNRFRSGFWLSVLVLEKRLSGGEREWLRAHGLIAGLSARSEPRARSLAYLQGLLSGCERKNGWRLAEWMEEAAPYAVQHLLDRARWEADEARDRLRSYALDGCAVMSWMSWAIQMPYRSPTRRVS